MTETDGTFFIDVVNQLIHVFSQKFSTYAIGYTTEPEPVPFPSHNPESPAQIHSCTSICDVCGGCEDVACTENGCKNKCLLLSMYFADMAVGKWYTEAVRWAASSAMSPA